MLTAPVSSLYAFGRKQGIALQRGRSNISQRNHMRLWLAPFRCEGQPVWVGQVSRDIGVKLTRKSPTLTNARDDPVVDESREYLSTACSTTRRWTGSPSYVVSVSDTLRIRAAI